MEECAGWSDAEPHAWRGLTGEPYHICRAKHEGAISAAIADSGNGETPGARHAIAGSSGASTCHMTMCLDRRALAPGTFVSNRPAETVESGSCQMPDWGLQRVLP
jgi:hypothetical protein